MRLLDRYVIREFLKTFLFALLAFSVIFIIIDMIENLDDFIDRNVPWNIILLYYTYFLPRIFSLMVPVAMLLAGLFTTGRLNTTNELTIIKTGGVSLARFMLPFVAAGLLMSGAMIAFDGWAVPRINAARLHLEREYLGKNIRMGGRYNLYFEESGGRILEMDYFDEASASARRVSLQQFDRRDPTMMLRRLDAEAMSWRPASGDWVLRKGLERRFAPDTTIAVTRRETVRPFDSLEIGPLTVTPVNILRMQQKPEEMEIGDFRDYIERQRASGGDIARLTVDYHGKIAFPFASFIVVLFGVPFAAAKRRSGLSVQFGISLLICFVYMVCQKVSQVFGYDGDMNPLLAAWLPNILFFLTGCAVILRARR